MTDNIQYHEFFADSRHEKNIISQRLFTDLTFILKTVLVTDFNVDFTNVVNILIMKHSKYSYDDSEYINYRLRTYITSNDLKIDFIIVLHDDTINVYSTLNKNHMNYKINEMIVTLIMRGDQYPKCSFEDDQKYLLRLIELAVSNSHKCDFIYPCFGIEEPMKLFYDETFYKNDQYKFTVTLFEKIMTEYLTLFYSSDFYDIKEFINASFTYFTAGGGALKYCMMNKFEGVVLHRNMHGEDIEVPLLANYVRYTLFDVNYFYTSTFTSVKKTESSREKEHPGTKEEYLHDIDFCIKHIIATKQVKKHNYKVLINNTHYDCQNIDKNNYDCIIYWNSNSSNNVITVLFHDIELRISLNECVLDCIMKGNIYNICEGNIYNYFHFHFKNDKYIIKLSSIENIVLKNQITKDDLVDSKNHWDSKGFVFSEFSKSMKLWTKSVCVTGETFDYEKYINDCHEYLIKSNIHVRNDFFKTYPKSFLFITLPEPGESDNLTYPILHKYMNDR